MTRSSTKPSATAATEPNEWQDYPDEIIRKTLRLRQRSNQKWNTVAGKLQRNRKDWCVLARARLPTGAKLYLYVYIYYLCWRHDRQKTLMMLLATTTGRCWRWWRRGNSNTRGGWMSWALTLSDLPHQAAVDSCAWLTGRGSVIITLRKMTHTRSLSLFNNWEVVFLSRRRRIDTGLVVQVNVVIIVVWTGNGIQHVNGPFESISEASLMFNPRMEWNGNKFPYYQICLRVDPHAIVPPPSGHSDMLGRNWINR